MLGTLAPRRRRLIGGLIAVVLVLVAVVALRILTRRATPTGFPDQAAPGPVLLVPGFGGNTGSLAVLAERLRATGREATVIVPPGDGTGDLGAQAAAVQAAVNAALATGARSVDLIGYSAGGVVVRLWLSRYSGEHVARRVVTLGSPLHGARIAAAGSVLVADACPLACQQLAPGSALLAEIDRSPVPERLPWLSVWTEVDQTVRPPDSARLDGAVNVAVQSVCADARTPHGGLPTDPLVAGLVLRALTTAPLVAPGPGECGELRDLGRASR